MLWKLWCTSLSGMNLLTQKLELLWTEIPSSTVRPTQWCLTEKYPLLRSHHIYRAVGIQGFIDAGAQGLALSLGTAVYGDFISTIPWRVCWGFHWDTLQLDFSLCLLWLPSLPFPSCPQKSSLINPIYSASQSAPLRTQPVAELRKPTDSEWRKPCCILWNATNPLISLSLCFFIHWYTYYSKWCQIFSGPKS